MGAVEFLNKPVVMDGIELGRAVDVFFDGSADEPIGLEVRCKDGVHRFLPISTAELGESEVTVESPLVLLDRDQLDFYRARGRALRSTR